MKNIYIVGFMGTGKTVIGKILAQKLGKDFIETDEQIESRQGKKIVDIFSQNGEASFRAREKEIIRKLSSQKDLVISCGGGLICNAENLELLKKTGLVFCLAASAETIYERTKKDKNRPLLNVNNPLDKIKNLLQERTSYYAQAHYAIDTEGISPKGIVRKIISILNNG